MLHNGSNIPKAKTFRFENFWIEHPGFLDTVGLHWNNSAYHANAAKNLSFKSKQVRAGLKKWNKNLSSLSKLIYSCNWVLLLMDGLEDQRSISRLELSLRILVKNHLNSLLESKRLYWRQRNLVRSATLGDENTHFFHTMATISHKRNFIVSLSNVAGEVITDHEQKANLLWSTYKQRLGISEYTGMVYNLSSILTSHDLDGLDSDFSQAEIDFVGKNLPNSHAPRPDGFNGLFVKKCWSIIKNDFVRVFNDFNMHNLDLRSINTSVIALVPKKDNPKCVDDYRPISLLNYNLKCITKLLSQGLQNVILDLVHPNQ